MSVLIVKNISREGPGLLDEILRQHNITSHTVDLSEGNPVFPGPSAYKAMVVLGGPDSANDNSDKMRTELSRITMALNVNMPYLGICLGMQALVKAAGGEVYKCLAPEIGWRAQAGSFFELDLTTEGAADSLFNGIKSHASSPRRVFQLHGETVKLAEGMVPLATGNGLCQVVKISEKPAYGIQGHFELTPGMFQQWLREDPDLRRLDAASLKRDYATVRADYERAGRQLFTNFLKIAGVIS